MTQDDDGNGGFYASLPLFDRFDQIVDPKIYRPLPDGWSLGLSDVMGSTQAIAAGRYKRVNMAGAAAISAIVNALGGQDLPFVFGGDGSAILLPPNATIKAAAALAATARWVRDDLDLTLRVALVPMAAVREAGHDVRVARYRASPHVCYAMLSGGGVSWADAAMKDGAFGVEPAAPGTRPDLTGLSCRWTPIAASRGTIVSILVMPVAGGDRAAFAQLIVDLVALSASGGRAGHPVPAEGPGFSWPPTGLDLEARATRGAGSLAAARRKLYAITFLAWILDKTRWKVGGFDPLAYRRNTALNADYRKFDDGLRMTLDCDAETLAAIEGRLEAARDDGTCRYGLHRQAEALMTCIVPSPLRHDHFHFVDGAGGGYALAARQLKGMGDGSDAVTR
ncbi:MAG: DUF3095 domain-containing protein [Inquilinaceae bacterium]